MDQLPEFPPEKIERMFPGGFTLRDEANAIVAYAFRNNGPLEDLHAGKYSELLEDPSLSRITQDEMKALILSMCDSIETLLRLKTDRPSQYNTIMQAYAALSCGNWDR